MDKTLPQYEHTLGCLLYLFKNVFQSIKSLSNLSILNSPSGDDYLDQSSIGSYISLN